MSDISVKQNIRHLSRVARQKLSDEEILMAANDAADLLMASPLFSHSHHIAVHYPYNNELSTQPLIDAIWQSGKNCYLPILSIEQKDFLHFGRYEKQDPLQLNKFGIPEPVCDKTECILPTELDLVIVPLLAFDEEGHRLGTGAGYYDRTFAFKKENRNAKPILCGYAYSFQQVESLTPESWDVDLDGVVTETLFLKF